MSTRITSHVVARHQKIPFNLLVDVDEELETENDDIKDTAPKLRNMVDKFVGNLKKQQRYKPYDHTEYKHTRLRTVNDIEEYNIPDEVVLDDEERARSSSMEGISDISHHFPPSSAFMGRRRSRSDSDLIAMFAQRARRAAICEEMERGILMENGITLRKCRKNLVLNQILENLSLL